MTKYKTKTTETSNNVFDFIETLLDKQRHNDSLIIIDIMRKQSGFEPKMWGSNIIGFGSYHYKYESGHEGDAPLVSFAPRKTEFALYFPNFENKDILLNEFGKHKKAKACIYIRKVEDISIDILKKLISKSIEYYQTKYK